MLTTSVKTQSRGYATETTQTVRTGTTLIDELPIVHTVEDQFVDTHCHHCLKCLKSEDASSLGLSSSGRTFRCKTCKFTLYCSPQCFKDDVASVHKFECLALQRLRTLKRFEAANYTQSIRLASRFFLKYREQVDPLQIIREREMVSSCMAQEHDQQNLQGLAMLIFHMLQLIREKLPDTFDISPDSIYELLCRFRVNVIGICDNDLNCVGVGLYKELSRVNHSCSPNCAVVFYGHRVVLKSLQPLTKGEEITVSYIELAQSTDKRREILLSKYEFECHCHRCENRVGDKVLTELSSNYSQELEQKGKALWLEGEKLHAIRDIPSAFDRFSRCLEIYKKIYGANHESVVDVSSRLSHLAVYLQKFDKALEYANNCTPVFELCYPKLFRLLGVHYSMINHLSMNCGKESQALHYMEKALNILKHWATEEELRMLNGS